MFLKRVQPGPVHVAAAMTLVPINSTLNRVMIKESALSAALVAILASLPYLFSPVQAAIGPYSDRRPLFGLRRSSYNILAGLLMLRSIDLSVFRKQAAQPSFAERAALAADQLHRKGIPGCPQPNFGQRYRKE